MAMGDGLADIIGRRYGSKKWPFATTKSYIGSLAFVISSFIATIGILAWYNYTGVLSFDVMNLWPKLLLISIVCAGVELMDIADDNWTVPLTGGIMAAYLFK
jgi:farnesol kinase